MSLALNGTSVIPYLERSNAIKIELYVIEQPFISTWDCHMCDVYIHMYCDDKYRRSGNFRCKNIFVVCANHENKKKTRNIFYNR